MLDYAAAGNVLIGFEPEPGMFIDTMRAFEELLAHMEPGGADIPVGGRTFLSASQDLPQQTDKNVCPPGVPACN